jgi:hypothetical protein
MQNVLTICGDVLESVAEQLLERITASKMSLVENGPLFAPDSVLALVPACHLFRCKPYLRMLGGEPTFQGLPELLQRYKVQFVQFHAPGVHPIRMRTSLGPEGLPESCDVDEDGHPLLHADLVRATVAAIIKVFDRAEHPATRLQGMRNRLQGLADSIPPELVTVSPFRIV